MIKIGIHRDVHQYIFSDLYPDSDLLQHDEIAHFNIHEAEENDALISFIEAIKNENLHTAVLPLSNLPFLDQDVIIAALSTRIDVGDCMIIKENAFDSNAELKIKDGSKIGYEDVRQYGQLRYLNPSWELLPYAQSNALPIELLQQDKLDALIVSKWALKTSGHNVSQYKLLFLHPKELLPTPGNGRLAWLCHREDLVTRRWLQQFHAKGEVATSNIERSVLQLCKKEESPCLGVYCYVDQKYNYHTIAIRSDIYKKVQISQSTTFDMAQKVYRTLFH